MASPLPRRGIAVLGLTLLLAGPGAAETVFEQDDVRVEVPPDFVPVAPGAQKKLREFLWKDFEGVIGRGPRLEGLSLRLYLRPTVNGNDVFFVGFVPGHSHRVGAPFWSDYLGNLEHTADRPYSTRGQWRQTQVGVLPAVEICYRPEWVESPGLLRYLYVPRRDDLVLLGLVLVAADADENVRAWERLLATLTCRGTPPPDAPTNASAVPLLLAVFVPGALLGLSWAWWLRRRERRRRLPRAAQPGSLSPGARS